MEDKVNFQSFPLAGIRIEKNFNCCSFSARLGNYSILDFQSTVSNQNHSHDCYEAVLVISGKGTSVYNGDENVIQTGDVLVTEPETLHELHVAIYEKLTVLYFFFTIRKKPIQTGTSLEELILQSFLSGHRNITKNQHYLLCHINFLEEYSKNHHGSNKSWLIHHLESFIFEWIESTVIQAASIRSQEAAEGSLLEKALDFIDQNLDKKLSAEEIALSVHTSTRNLYALFRNHLNRSVNDYVNFRKISLAEYYMNMNLRISEAARLVNVDSLSRFNFLFKKYTGLSPREYKKTNPSSVGGYGRRDFFEP